MAQWQHISLERPEAGIAILRMNRPDALNAFTLDMMRDFHEALREIDEDDGVRVVVLASEGRGFCAGLDLKAVERPDGVKSQPVESMALQELFASAPLRMRRLRQPIVAAVGGVAVGAGFALALGADVRVASASARFLIGAVKIGLTAGECGISYHLPRMIGASRAFEIMLTGRPVDADEAATIGLVSKVVEPDMLMATAMDLARAIALNSPYAVKHTKQLMWSNLDAPSLDAAIQLENHAQVVALVTDDFNEATRAFGEKRSPIFRGR